MHAFSKFSPTHSQEPERDDYLSFRADSDDIDWSLPPNQMGLPDYLDAPVLSGAGSSGLNHSSRSYRALPAYGSSSRAPAPGLISNVSSSQKKSSLTRVSDPSDNHDRSIVGVHNLRAENEKMKKDIYGIQRRVESINTAYVRHHRVVTELRDAVIGVRSDVQKVAQQIEAIIAGKVPGVLSILSDLKEEDFPGINYWHRCLWSTAKEEGVQGTNVASPLISIFFEDEFGNPVSDDVKQEVRGDLFAYWADMVKAGETPVQYSSLGLNRREDYRKTMEAKYPWLRLCDGHWKVRQIWINYWKKERFPSNGGRNNSPIVISSDTDDSGFASRQLDAIIDITSDEDNVASTGSKRRRQDKDDSASAPSKKLKGKAPAISNDFHPPRPLPKKKVSAKLGKVDLLYPVLSCLADHNAHYPPSAGIHVTPSIPESPPVQNTLVASGSGSRNAKANLTTPSTPSVRNSPASSRSRTLDSTDVPPPPTQEQTLVTMSRIAREVLNASITAPLTQVGSPHNDRSVTLDDIESVTESSSPVPAIPTHPRPVTLDDIESITEPSSPVPAIPTHPRPPNIVPIASASTKKTPRSQESDGVDEPSPTPKPASKPVAKKAKTRGPFAWRQSWLKEWLQTEGNTDASFKRFLKTLDDDTKNAKIEELKLAAANAA